ncbi:hypothetical protein KIN20_021611 [Parelaphostrongylus tenuis]|uniref:Uncharacterized protein n=1 Tax=Parelaphostrongylus tenuis TaxID=148309 RepID=A0AAD5MP47_PARTN|nr:hypothetical protein KIN20_021611 [Parelaphostrongylus tenuis]
MDAKKGSTDYHVKNSETLCFFLKSGPEHFRYCLCILHQIERTLGCAICHGKYKSPRTRGTIGYYCVWKNFARKATIVSKELKHTIHYCKTSEDYQLCTILDWLLHKIYKMW